MSEAKPPAVSADEIAVHDPDDALGRATTDDAPRWEIIALRVCAIAAITPIIIAAVRNGLNGWTPTLDAAATTTRVRDVFSAHPPLVGMWSAGSTWSDYTIHFPGAIQLYLLAIPVKVLGNTWGVLLGMATLNSAWILTAGWLIKRRIGVRGAILGYAFLALFVWTLGSEILIDITPMQMVTVPFMVFLVAVWSVADGDTKAIPVVALVANYLLLAHLAFTLLVPAIGLTAIVGLIISARRARRTNPEAWPATRGEIRSGLLKSLAITGVLWLIPLLQQLFGEIPNITNLIKSSQVDRPSTSTYGDAAHAVASIILQPPFWLRDSFAQPKFGLEDLGGALAIGVIITAFTIVALAVVAVRRQEFTVLWALVVASVAALVSIANVVQAPNPYGFRPEYLRSLWGMAMFVWLAIAVAFWRLAATPKIRERLTGGLAVCVLLIAGLAIPHRNFRAGTSDASIPATNAMLDQVLPKLHDKGTVEVTVAGEFDAFTYWSALILALNTKGIPYCLSESNAIAQYGKNRNCKHGVDYVVTVRIGPVKPMLGQTKLASVNRISPEHKRQLTKLQATMKRWLATQREIRPTPEFTSKLAPLYGTAWQGYLDKYFSPPGDDITTFADSLNLANLIAQYTVISGDKVTLPIIAPGIDPMVLYEWSKLFPESYSSLLSVWGTPPAAPK